MNTLSLSKYFLVIEKVCFDFFLYDTFQTKITKYVKVRNHKFKFYSMIISIFSLFFKFFIKKLY